MNNTISFKEMNTPLVSIMIPTYNQSNYIADTINSVLKQDYPELEIIVSDDCSIDDTEKIVKSFKDDRIRYLKQKTNIGRVANYHKLLYEYAVGEWVLNLDGDDLLLDKRFISSAISATKVKKQPVFIFADRYEKDDPFFITTYTDNIDTSTIEYLDGTAYVLSLPKPKYHIHHLSVLYNRTMAISINFYRSDIISSDYESLWRLALENTIVHIPSRVAIWRRHSKNASRTVGIDSNIKNYQLFQNVYDYSIQNIDKKYKPLFEKWLIRNVANKFYGGICKFLKLGDFNSLVILSHYINTNYPSSFKRVLLSPKTIIKSIFSLLVGLKHRLQKVLIKI